jgi:hypothetical protein
VSTTGAWRARPARDQHERHGPVARIPGPFAMPNGMPAGLADRIGTPS